MAEITEFAQALLEATQKELAWRIAFNQCASDLLASSAGAKVSMTSMQDAEREYTRALIKMHQAAKRWATSEAAPNPQQVEGMPTGRANWVHHVDFYQDGSVGIDRYGCDVRVYQATETSARRLKNTIDRLAWSWRPPTKLDANFGTLKNRAVAPMRRFK